MRIIVNWIIAIVAIVIAVYVAHALLPNHIVLLEGPRGRFPLGAVIIFAIVLGLLNAFVRPILSILTFPLTILTLGLFSLVINAVLFYVAGHLTGRVGVDVLGAFVGAILVSIVNTILGMLL